MDEQTEKKIRDLKLRITMAEKELTATQNSMKLGVMLKAGHAGQMAKNAERDRERLESKLETLRAKLLELDPLQAEVLPQPNSVEEPIKPPTTKTATVKTDAVKKTKKVKE
jgi:hypothetical protein